MDDLASSFKARLERVLLRLDKRLDAYIDNPEDERYVHDIRTSLRRLDSMFLLVSDEARKTNLRRIGKYKEFFKANSGVRDCDIIIARLALLSPDTKQILVGLKKKRRAEFDMVLAKAKAFRKGDRIRIGSINSEELAGRLEQVVLKLCNRINANLPVVLSDSRNVEQLHSLRKDLKKLRYILESLDDKAAQRYRKKITEATLLRASMSTLDKLQDMLGEIHDSDITLEFLRSAQAAEARKLRAKEEQIRASLYKGFVQFIKSRLDAQR